MTSRERVRAAINHQEPDRVPVDLGGMRSTGMMALAYARLKEYLGIKEGEVFVYDVVQNLAQPEDMILERFQIDVVDLGRVFVTEPEERKPFTLMDGTLAMVPTWFDPEPDGQGGYVIRGDQDQVIGLMPKSQPYVTQCYWPLSEGVTEAKLDNLAYHMGQVTWGRLPTAPFHKPLTDEWLQEVARRAKKLWETTDYAIMLSFGGNLLEWSQYLRGFGDILYDLAGDPSSAHRLLDALTEVHLANLEKIMPVLGPYVDIVVMGDDLGTQNGPQMSPEMYREFFLPRHRAIYQRAKELGDVKIFMHSCGGLWELIPSLIEAGVQILNPVQTSAVNMEPEKLKREFGKDLCFWGGGCEPQGVLTHGTPEEVKAQVRERKAIFGQGGGFVFNQIHNILSNIPPENVVAMLEAAGED